MGARAIEVGDIRLGRSDGLLRRGEGGSRRVNVDVRAPCDGGGAVEVPHQVQNPLLDLLTDALAGPVNCVIYGANDISNHKPAGMQ